MDFSYRCKQAGQLASKMRFVAAQWVGILQGNAWQQHAGRTHRMALRLREAIEGLPGVALPYPTEANSVFVRADSRILHGLRDKGWRFYEFIGGASRFMTSWDTTAQDIAELEADFRELCP